MNKTVINMLSKADTVKGHGVLSAYEEQVSLVREGLSDEFEVVENHPFLGDILHLHTVNLGFYLRSLFRRPSVKTIGYVHYIPETLEKSLTLPPVIKQIFYRYIVHFYSRMDYLVTVNPCFIEKLAALGIDREKITYIPNFVSDDKFYAVDRGQKPALRARYGLAPDRFTVLSVGQLQVRKGVHEFVELAKTLPDINFVWAGDFTFGKISDGYAEIKRLVADPPANVTFLGLVPRENMNDVYNLADVLFQPSYDELFPMTTLEAMCVGLPLLLRDLTLYEDILFDYYLRGHDNGDFRRALLALQDNEEHGKACALSRKGHEFYSRESVLRQWQRYYEAVAMAAALTGRASHRRLRRV